MLCLAASSGLPLPHPMSQSPWKEESPEPKGALKVDWDPPRLCALSKGGGDASGSRSVTPGDRGHCTLALPEHWAQPMWTPPDLHYSPPNLPAGDRTLWRNPGKGPHTSMVWSPFPRQG